MEERPSLRPSQVKSTAQDSAGPTLSEVRQSEGRSGPSTPLKSIGRYRVIKELGRGGFGIVYHGHDPQMDREVAIKLLRDERACSDQLRARFLREARIAAAISHPNICPVYSIHETPDAIVLILPMLDGKTLATMLKSTAFSPSMAIQIVYKLATALTHAHEKGIVHRDLKPANIMIDADNEPIIMDFGLALQAGAGDTRLTVQGDVLGTPIYMSPEQARGDVQQIGPATDIYSLGVIFYELLTGQRPFSGPLAGLLSKVERGDFPTPTSIQPDLDRSIEAICLKAMARQPRQRFKSMAELALALSSLPQMKNEESVVPSTAPSSKAASQRPGKRKARVAPPSPVMRGKKQQSPSGGNRKFILIVTAVGLLSVCGLVGAYRMAFGTKATEAGDDMPITRSASLFPEPMLVGAWSVERPLPVAGRPGAQEGIAGTAERRWATEVFLIDRDGNVAFQFDGRLYGGPLYASGLALAAEVSQHDRAAKTVTLKFQAGFSSRQLADRQLKIDLEAFPTEWEVRFVDESHLDITETRMVVETNVREVRHTVIVPVFEQVDGTVRQKLVPEERAKTETVKRLVPIRETIRAHLAIRQSSPMPPAGALFAEMKSISGQPATFPIPDSQAPFSTQSTFVSNQSRERDARIQKAAGVTDWEVVFQSQVGAMGTDIFFYGQADTSGAANDAERHWAIALWSQPSEFCAQNLFRIVPNDPARALSSRSPVPTRPEGPFEGLAANAAPRAYAVPASVAENLNGGWLIPIEVDNYQSDSHSFDPNVTLEITSPFQHGEVVHTSVLTNPDPTTGYASLMLSYRAAAGYHGPDQCRYKLKRGSQESNEGSLSLWVTDGSRPLSPFPAFPFGAAALPANGAAPAPIAPARASSSDSSAPVVIGD